MIFQKFVTLINIFQSKLTFQTLNKSTLSLPSDKKIVFLYLFLLKFCPCIETSEDLMKVISIVNPLFTCQKSIQV
jgi:hypothetical protein